MSWFQALEQLFQQLKVPSDLQAVLMRPYLSDRAKSLLARVDLDKSTEYNAVKKYLLQETHLSPSVYLDKFQSVCRESTETYHQFANKLSALFEYYVDNRKVDKSYDKLMELIVYDRVKASLPSFLSRHVLALESSSTLLDKGGWLGKSALVEALDAYTAGMPPSHSSSKNAGTGNNGGVKQNDKSPNPPKQKPKPEVPNHGSKEGVNTPKAAPMRRCYYCKSPGHLIINCPKRTTGAGQDRNPPSGPHVSTNACAISSNIELSTESKDGILVAMSVMMICL